MHAWRNPLATLVVSQRDTFRYLLFDDDIRLKGWTNEKTGELKPLGFSKPQLYNKLAFSGIQVLSPAIFELMESYDEKFPIMDFYLNSLKQNVIAGFIPDNYKMMDIGKIDTLHEAEEFVRQLA